jgi:hypothetical protein
MARTSADSYLVEKISRLPGTLEMVDNKDSWASVFIGGLGFLVVDLVDVAFSLSCTFVLITRTALALRSTNLEKKIRKEMGDFETF